MQRRLHGSVEAQLAHLEEEIAAEEALLHDQGLGAGPEVSLMAPSALCLRFLVPLPEKVRNYNRCRSSKAVWKMTKMSRTRRKMKRRRPPTLLHTTP